MIFPVMDSVISIQKLSDLNKSYCSPMNSQCAFHHYVCSQPCLEGFQFCLKHILEDKTAPFTQCSYVYSSSGRRCFRPAPIENKKDCYCQEHGHLMLHQECSNKAKQISSGAKVLLEQLSHHQIDPLISTQSAIPDPAGVPSLAITTLAYDSGDDSDLNVDVTKLPRLEDDSDLESADSDCGPLDHARIYTHEEVVQVYMDKMQKLKDMYLDELLFLKHSLKENRRRYLKKLLKEKETMMSIYNQPKDSADELEAYECLKAMNCKNKNSGQCALLYYKLWEKRFQATGDSVGKPSVSSQKCIFGEGSWRCGEQVIPLSRYCSKHILHDSGQVLYQSCNAVKGDSGDACETPIIPLPHIAHCIYHVPLPLPLPVSEPIHHESLPQDFQYNKDVIDLSDTSAFIVSELPPHQVMKDDDSMPDLPGTDTSCNQIVPSFSAASSASPVNTNISLDKVSELPGSFQDVPSGHKLCEEKTGTDISIKLDTKVDVKLEASSNSKHLDNIMYDDLQGCAISDSSAVSHLGKNEGNSEGLPKNNSALNESRESVESDIIEVQL